MKHNNPNISQMVQHGHSAPFRWQIIKQEPSHKTEPLTPDDINLLSVHTRGRAEESSRCLWPQAVGARLKSEDGFWAEGGNQSHSQAQLQALWSALKPKAPPAQRLKHLNWKVAETGHRSFRDHVSIPQEPLWNLKRQVMTRKFFF